MASSQFVTVARVEDVLPGTVTTVTVDGRKLALARVEDEFYATQQECLHLGGPLCEGRLDGHLLTCPWHGWQYDVRTGKNAFDLAIQIETFEVRVDDGEVKIDV